jgi:gentisate 1,2-dioxygenase
VTHDTFTQNFIMASSSSSSPSSEFFSSLPGKNVEPLWTVLHKMVPPFPNPGARPCLWRYKDLHPTLLESGGIVSADEAERRVLMLVNPNLEAPCSTDTIYAGLQLVLPSEIAPAHRHVAFALRFIVEGSRGFTAVEGQKLMMERGDVILTPSWHWHDHGNEGDRPMIWLDGLDLPVFKFMRSNFAENYSEPRYPSTPAPPDSPFKFPWAPVAEALDAAGGAHAVHHYHRPGSKHLSKTISAQAERVSAGSSSPCSRETCSFVYHVYEGSGHTTMELADGSVKTVEWTTSDTFAVPSWTKVSHTCTDSSGSAYLFAINDRPIMESLGTFRDDK